MFYSNPSEAIQAVRQSIDEVAGIGHENLQKKLGFLDFSFSAANPTEVRQEMLNSENSDIYRPVQVTYYKRDFGATINDDPATFSCAAGNEKQKFTTMVQPQLFASDKFSISEKYMREVVQEGNIAEIRDKYFRQKMRVLREHVDLKLFTKAAANMGANPAAGSTDPGNGSTVPPGPGAAGVYQPLDLLKADGTLNYNTFDTVKNQMEDNLLPGNFAAIGLGNLRHYMNLMNVSAINDDGINYQEVMNNLGFGFAKDQNTTAALGAANNFLVVAPGFVQPFHYNTNRGDYNIVISNTEGKGSLQDPVYPQLRWDFDYSYERCAGTDTTQGVYTFRLWLYYDLFIVPTSIFEATDPLYGVNGIFGYSANKAA